MLRRLLSVRWLLGLLLTLAAAAVMLRLGKWQLGRGEQRHSLQNYSYAVEWVLFAGFALFCFVKLLRDADRVPDGSESDPDRDVVVPPAAVRPADEPADDELAVYNAYLARLDREHRG